MAPSDFYRALDPSSHCGRLVLRCALAALPATEFLSVRPPIFLHVFGAPSLYFWGSS